MRCTSPARRQWNPLTQVFAKEMRGRNITVNAVAPGPVATDLFLHGKSEEQIQTFAKMPPLERLAQPEDISRVVSFWSARIRPGSTGKSCALTAGWFNYARCIGP